MEVLDRITNALKEKKKTQKELCEYVGISKNAYTNWKSGHMKSYERYLPKIAEFLGVSVDYLLGNTDKKESPSDISEDDKMVLQAFKSLTAEQQESLLSLMRSMVEGREEC